MRRAKAPGGPEQLERAALAKRKQMKASREAHDRKAVWYLEADADEAAKLVDKQVSQWMRLDERRLYDLGYFAKLYGTARLGFSGTLMQGRSFRTRTNYINPLAATFNGCRSCVDTISNTVTQHRPVVEAAATDGDWKAHKVAKMRMRFFGGWFYEQQIYKKTRVAFRDSGAWGKGLIGVFPKNGRAVAERVFPGDLFLNPATCITSAEPMEIARVRLIDRQEAYAMFEGDAEAQQAIMEAEEEDITVDSMVTDSDDLIRLNEIWRVSSAPGVPDGRHLISTTTKAVRLRPWRWPNLPFASVDCSDPVFGYWPQGLVEQLQNLQLQYNDLSYSVNEAHDMGGRFKLFVNSASNIVVDNITNESGIVLRGDGEPRSMLWQLVQPEIYTRLKELEEQFYRQAGIAQMVAQASEPDVPESGIARRERVAIYDERHASWVQSYQDMHITLGTLAIQTVQDLLDDEKAAAEDPAKWKGTYTVYSVKGPKADPIDFAELGFKPDEQYVLRSMPVNDLPDKIEGRVALAQEYVQNGWYDEATAREVFHLPDISRVESLYNAAYEYYTKVLDAAVEDGTPIPEPESFDNLQLALRLSLQQLLYAKNRGISSKNCDLIRNYITQLEALVMAAQQGGPMANAQAQVSSPANDPLADPKSPGTSDLLPNPNAGKAA
jgi:hypothetical protein